MSYYVSYTFLFLISLQLSYIASTSSTVDRDLFSTMFKVNQIMDDLNPLRIKMMQYFNWRRVGTIYFQDDVNTSVSILLKFSPTIITDTEMTAEVATRSRGYKTVFHAQLN